MAAKGILKLAFISIMFCAFVLYGGMGPSEKTTVSPKQGSIFNELHRKEMVEFGRKVVIVLSNQRSGSSFVGSFFEHNNNGFYLFEPLHPYGMSCTALQEERLNFLKRISQCDFSTLVQDYTNAYNVTRVKSHHECLRNHLCTMYRHQEMIKRYSVLCHAQRELDIAAGKNFNKSCIGNPIDIDLWTSMCRSSNVVAFKILRVCSVEALEDFSRQLSDLGKEVYVIELVRDPRGITNSALKLELRLKDLDDRLKSVCGRFRSNLDYEKSQVKYKGDGIISGGRYMRIRYEDIAEYPARAAKKIYGFIGESAPEEVLSWLDEATGGTETLIRTLKQQLADENLPPEEQIVLRKKIVLAIREANNPYGTTRNATNVLTKWRKKLSMEVVQKIQDKCGDVMAELGYKMVHSEEEKMNFSLKVW